MPGTDTLDGDVESVTSVVYLPIQNEDTTLLEYEEWLSLTFHEFCNGVHLANGEEGEIEEPSSQTEENISLPAKGEEGEIEEPVLQTEENISLPANGEEGGEIEEPVRQTEENISLPANGEEAEIEEPVLQTEENISLPANGEEGEIEELSSQTEENISSHEDCKQIAGGWRSGGDWCRQQALSVLFNCESLSADRLNSNTSGLVAKLCSQVKSTERSISTTTSETPPVSSTPPSHVANFYPIDTEMKEVAVGIRCVHEEVEIAIAVADPTMGLRYPDTTINKMLESMMQMQRNTNGCRGNSDAGFSFQRPTSAIVMYARFSLDDEHHHVDWQRPRICFRHHVVPPLKQQPLDEFENIVSNNGSTNVGVKCDMNKIMEFCEAIALYSSRIGPTYHKHYADASGVPVWGKPSFCRDTTELRNAMNPTHFRTDVITGYFNHHATLKVEHRTVPELLMHQLSEVPSDVAEAVGIKGKELTSIKLYELLPKAPITYQTLIQSLGQHRIEFSDRCQVETTSEDSILLRDTNFTTPCRDFQSLYNVLVLAGQLSERIKEYEPLLRNAVDRAEDMNTKRQEIQKIESVETVSVENMPCLAVRLYGHNNKCLILGAGLVDLKGSLSLEECRNFQEYKAQMSKERSSSFHRAGSNFA